MIVFTPYASPLGTITLAGEEDGLIGVWFDGQKYDRQCLAGITPVRGTLPVLNEAARWLDRYFAGEDSDERPKLRVVGSPFRRLILELLLEIPYGQTVSYARLAEEAARRLGRTRMSAQAVGGAVGHNPLSILIPCHRVVGSDGSLTGYAGGLERKCRLLELEGIHVDRDQRLPRVSI